MNCINHPERERVAFCQNCGKALCAECSRAVGTAVFCEPCLAAKLAGRTAAAAGFGAASAANSSANYTADGTPNPYTTSDPSPGLAALLGFIPGVGAMYNGQYAKGIVHLTVFAILVSLAGHDNGIFGLFVGGWVIYQVIEAHHTARARRDGTPLPNPFGLNEIGERLGFGRAWPAGGTDARPDAGYDAGAAAGSGMPLNYAAGTTPPAGSAGPEWSAPAEGYGAGASGIPPVSPNAGQPPYGTYPAASADGAAAVSAYNRVPSGAIWLIGLGIVFLIGNSSLFGPIELHRLFPLLIIGVGVWLFVRKMMESGVSVTDDGDPMYRLRVVRALRGSVWVVVAGVLFLLDSFDILSFHHSWPLFIILAGVMTFLERAIANQTLSHPYAYAATPPVNRPAAASTSVVPTVDNDQEGR